MEKTDKKITLLILVLKQIWQTCEGLAHQEERFPPTLLHTGQLSERTAHICLMEHNTASQQPGLVLEKRGRQ